MITIKESIQNKQEEEAAKSTEEKIDQELTNEFLRLIEYMTKNLGVASSACQDKMKELIDQHGLVKVTIAVTNRLASFNPDISYYFAKEIEKNLKEDYL